MLKTSSLLMTTSVLAWTIGAIFFAGRQESAASASDEHAEYQLDVYCAQGQAPTAIFVVKGTGMMGREWKCAGWCTDGGVTTKVMIADVLAKFPERVSKAFTDQIRTHERDAAIGIGNSIAGCGTPPKPKPPCEKYTGEIACDCNGDGMDDTSKSFESCAQPSDRPRTFKARCEDWVVGERDRYFFGHYPTDPVLAGQASDWLKSLSCPTLKCRGQYEQCAAYAESEYQQCVERRKYFPARPNCLARSTAANKRCQQARDACLKGASRSG